MTAGSTLPWADINASLMAVYLVLSHAGDRPCQSCNRCAWVGIILIPKSIRSVCAAPYSLTRSAILSYCEWVSVNYLSAIQLGGL